MAEVVRDIGKNVGRPIVKMVDDNQKKLRKGMVRLLEVPEDDKKSSRPILEDKKKSQKTEENLFTLESLRHWDVSMPPIKKRRFGLPLKTGVKSTMSKYSLGKVFKKKRRITIELYKKITPERSAKNKEQDQRVFNKLYPRASMASDENLLFDESMLDEGVLDESNVPPLEDEDCILIRILKEKKSGIRDFHDDDSHSEASHLPNGALESHMLTTYSVTDYGDGQETSAMASQWKERHRSRISTVEITEVESRVVTLKFGIGNSNEERDICFENPHEVETFVKTFEKMRELMLARGKRLAAEQRIHMDKQSPSKKKLEDSDAKKKKNGGINSTLLSSFMFGSVKSEPDTTVNLLIEIVSATNLPIADITSSDPYVCVEDGRTRLHKTHVVANTLHPVWTLSTGSMFLIQTNLTDFFAMANCIEFIVKDHDSVGANDILGSVLVKKTDLLEGNGDRVEYVLNTTRHSQEGDIRVGNKTSYLTVRSKQATEEEVDFLRTYEAKQETGMMSKLGLSSNIGVFAEDCYLPPRPHPSTLFKRNEKKADNGISVKYRMKPFPDPSRELETKWMSENQIQAEYKKPSRDWVEAGSGNVGKFYLEILGCDGLPNLDLSVSGRNKSDPYVMIAFEDCVVNTDVITDCLAPRWMPWTRRAFVFNVMHPSSQFFFAVMDYEGIKIKHDKIGRAIINPTNLRPNTMYTMRYSLLDSDEIDRKSTGKIMFRLRFETTTERQFLLSTFQMRTRYSVSTNSRPDSQTMSFALTNDYDRYVLSLETIQKYLDELFDYQLYLEDIYEAVQVVILWRGHFPLKFSFFGKSFTFKAPFHSMTAFTWAVLLSFDFDRFGSFICFAFAWTLFATLEVQRSNPNPWKRPRTYIDLLGTFLFNRSFAVHRIKVNENIEETMTYDQRRADQMKFRKETIDANFAKNELEQRKMEKEEKELDKQSRDQVVGLSYGPSRLFLAPFQDILVPVQKLLYKTCVYCRFAKSVIVWSDSIVAFWVASVALLLSAILFFVPWTFLFRWTFRIVSIVFLGPWMKLVDIFFIENVDDLTYEERKARMEAEMQSRYDFIMGESRIRRLHKEKRMKIRDMEKYLFGQYGVRVPIFKEERFASTPLAGGFAEPYDPTSHPHPNIVRRINGQVLTGNMIMKREDPAKEFKARKMKMGTDIPAVITAEPSTTKDEMAPLLNDSADEYPYGALDV